MKPMKAAFDIQTLALLLSKEVISLEYSFITTSTVSIRVLPSMPPVFAARSEQADVDLAFMDEALKMVRLTLY